MSYMEYNHGIMSSGIAEFQGHHAALNQIGEDIKGHQKAQGLASQGKGSQSYQQWQQQWNLGHSDVVAACNQICTALQSSLDGAMSADTHVGNMFNR